MALGSITLKALYYKVLPERAARVMERVKAIYPLVELSYQDERLRVSGPILRYHLGKRGEVSRLLRAEARRYKEQRGHGSARPSS